MGPRLVDPEVEKTFRERSKEEREALSDTLERVSWVLLRGSAALEAEHAKLKGRNKALGAGLAALRNV